MAKLLPEDCVIEYNPLRRKKRKSDIFLFSESEICWRLLFNSKLKSEEMTISGFDQFFSVSRLNRLLSRPNSDTYTATKCGHEFCRKYRIEPMPQKLQFETDCWDLAGLSDLPCKNLRHLSSLFHPPKLNNPIHPIRQCHHLSALSINYMICQKQRRKTIRLFKDTKEEI